MKCSKSDTCTNYDERCNDCIAMSSADDDKPYYVEKCDKKVRFKIFFGNHTLQSADDKLNQWMEQNPTARIISWQFQQARMGDHAIGIEYEEENNAAELHRRIEEVME